MLYQGPLIGCSLWALGYCFLQYLLISLSCTVRHKISKASVQMQFIYNQRFLLRELTGRNLIYENADTNRWERTAVRARRTGPSSQPETAALSPTEQGQLPTRVRNREKQYCSLKKSTQEGCSRY